MSRRYNWQLRGLVPVMFLYFLWRSLREPDYRKHWGERLGWVAAAPRQALWVHAASVGEVQAASLLLRAVRQQYPQLPLRMTVFTPAGRERAVQLAQDPLLAGLCVEYLPVDTVAAVNRYLRRSRPRLLVVMETEFWPNLLCACKAQGIPVLYASARLSAKSRDGLLKHLDTEFREEAVAAVRWFGTQSRADAQRLQAIGAAVEHIEVTGNVKFDCPPGEALRQRGMAQRQQWGAASRRVWLAASTHEGEEAIVLEAYQSLRGRWPDLLLLLAPRHPARFGRVVDVLRKQRRLFARRSAGDVIDAETEVILLDTLGELPWLYAAADLALVGGSLVPVGGHNLLEPVAVGTPVIVGPYTHQQQEMTERLLAEGALLQLQQPAQLAKAVEGLLSEPMRRQDLAQAATAVLIRNQGALARSLKQLTATLSLSPPA